MVDPARLNEVTPRLVLALQGHTDEMGEQIRDHMPKPSGCQDWVYRDIPWVPEATYRLLVAIGGETNISFIAESQRNDLVRAQWWVRPDAAAAMQQWAQGRQQ